MAESYTAMVSGVLMGMSEALQAGARPRRRSQEVARPRAAAAGPTLHAMKNVVITGTGLYRPPHVITNAELVEAFNAYADLQNAKNADAIAAGALPAMVHSSVEFIEKASGIKQRYVMDKAGVLDPTRMRPQFEPRPDEELSLMAEIAVDAAQQAMAAAGKTGGRHRRRAVRRGQHAARLPGDGLRDPGALGAAATAST